MLVTNSASVQAGDIGIGEMFIIRCKISIQLGGIIVKNLLYGTVSIIKNNVPILEYH